MLETGLKKCKIEFHDEYLPIFHYLAITFRIRNKLLDFFAGFRLGIQIPNILPYSPRKIK